MSIVVADPGICHLVVWICGEKRCLCECVIHKASVGCIRITVCVCVRLDSGWRWSECAQWVSVPLLLSTATGILPARILARRGFWPGHTHTHTRTLCAAYVFTLSLLIYSWFQEESPDPPPKVAMTSMWPKLMWIHWITMGKEQDLLDASRSGQLAIVEKILASRVKKGGLNLTR